MCFVSFGGFSRCRICKHVPGFYVISSWNCGTLGVMEKSALRIWSACRIKSANSNLSTQKTCEKLSNWLQTKILIISRILMDFVSYLGVPRFQWPMKRWAVLKLFSRSGTVKSWQRPWVRSLIFYGSWSGWIFFCGVAFFEFHAYLGKAIKFWFYFLCGWNLNQQPKNSWLSGLCLSNMWSVMEASHLISFPTFSPKSSLAAGGRTPQHPAGRQRFHGKNGGTFQSDDFGWFSKATSIPSWAFLPCGHSDIVKHP